MSGDMYGLIRVRIIVSLERWVECLRPIYLGIFLNPSAPAFIFFLSRDSRVILSGITGLLLLTESFALVIVQTRR